MKTVIESAFIEGRETDVAWDESQAKKNEIKVDVFVKNHQKYGERAINSNIPLAKVCPDTGKVLDMFYTRLDAAKHIVTTQNITYSPLSITGNMEMCMRLGWKSYGFYWKQVTMEEIDQWVKSKSAASDGKLIYLHTAKNTKIIKSVGEAARLYDIPTSTLRGNLNTGKVLKVAKGTCMQVYDPSRTTTITKFEFQQMWQGRDALKKQIERLTKSWRNGTLHITDDGSKTFKNCKILKTD